MTPETPETKLPPEFKAKWCEALRSGKYKQGKGYLAKRTLIPDTITYCCLGVACKVAGISDEEIMMKGLPSDSTIDFPNEMPFFFKGPDHVSTDVMDDLTRLNDGTDEDPQHKTFAEIADYIEANL